MTDHFRGPPQNAGFHVLIRKLMSSKGVRRFKNGTYTIGREVFIPASNTASGHQMWFENRFNR